MKTSNHIVREETCFRCNRQITVMEFAPRTDSRNG